MTTIHHNRPHYKKSEQVWGALVFLALSVPILFLMWMFCDLILFGEIPQ